QRQHLLALARLALALALFVAELAVVHQAAHRRARVGCDFNQVQVPFLGHGQSLVGRQNAQLLAVLIDDPHLADADLMVNPKVSADVTITSKTLSRQPKKRVLHGTRSQDRSRMGPLRGARRRDDGSYETAATTRRRR